MNRTTRRASWLATLLALGGLVLAQPAFARGGVEGQDMLAAKNEAQRTLQLEDTMLKLLTRTRIYNADGRQISFSQIPDPTTEAVMVEYEGRMNGSVVEVTRVVVRAAPN